MITIYFVAAKISCDTNTKQKTKIWTDVKHALQFTVDLESLNSQIIRKKNIPLQIKSRHVYSFIICNPYIFLSLLPMHQYDNPNIAGY